MATITRFREVELATAQISDPAATQDDVGDIFCSFCGDGIAMLATDASTTVDTSQDIHGGGGGYFNGSTPNNQSSEIFCCNRCAVENLPKLIADSIRVYPNNPQAGRKLWLNAERHFLEGFNSRLMSLLRRQQKEAGGKDNA